ncbi:adenylate/guanylate cyclase domain-containing protein [Hyalangium sp. s54d21]|uniref:Adenylate/guanylate cyclase domain-containing protein n=2 Tax=Hyalangium rubrum TaxID=3103134 RepID=A0ABU5H2R8_9BACT|nr:adenylate/guanylate cyclase domain-containing protein [Hyalangium sp. s54d21]MDY7227189.1 adenylate/guanylate cyclase domain-containing protein [Hyalangium sp. s54d21]
MPPTGTVALVFTDVQGATRLWERCPESMRDALEVHDAVLRALLDRGTGYEVKTQGGAFMLAFASPVEAVRWCLEAQEALLRAPWPEDLLSQPEAAEEWGPLGLLHRGLRVCMGVHMGEPECRIDERTGRADYFGRMVNAASRVAGAGHGGQVLVSGAAWARVAPEAEALGRPAVRPLGTFRLRGLESAVPLVEVLPSSLSERRFGAPRAPRERQGNVPAAQHELIGRATELETLRRWLREDTRVITLLGPGGMGKTRLATHLGGLELEACAWEGGVWLCELAEATTEDALCHAVAQALGVSLTRDGEVSEPVERLGLALNECGEALIILDNMEQATRPGAQLLERWMVLAPRARFLVTSRQELCLPGERLLELGPLPLPAPGETRLEEIARSEAVRLFVERTREVRGGFELTAEEAPRVVDIVRQLDGVALAIELAAARTGVLGVGQLRDRLSRRFELLRSGRRDASARQATLRGAIDWSWNLLEPAERDALAQCSVFRGGFTLEAAEAVVALPPGPLDVLDVIYSLRCKSLLRTQETDGPAEECRLGMYESVRQYAADRLPELGNAAELVARHADWYLALARGLRERAPREGVTEAHRRLARERENLLAVCDHALAVKPATSRSVAVALEALEALEPDIVARGPLSLLLTRLDQALELASAVALEPSRLASAWAVRGRAHLEAGNLDEARQDLEQARAALHGLGAVAGEKRVLVDLSIVARQQGDVAGAWELVQQAQGLPSGGDRWLEAYAVGHLGLVEQARKGAGAAIPHLRAARELFRAVGDVALEVGFTTHCAVAIGETGRLREGKALVEEAMTRAASVGDRAGHTLARLHLGCLLLEEGKASEAREHLTAAVRMGRQLGVRLLEGTAMGELGRAELALGDLAEARHWLAEAISVLDGVARWHALRFAAHRAAVDATLGDASAAIASFEALEEAPETSRCPVLRGLTTLLKTAADLALAEAASKGGEDARHAREAARRCVETFHGMPGEAFSSDMRGALRFLERLLSRGPELRG